MQSTEHKGPHWLSVVTGLAFYNSTLNNSFRNVTLLFLFFEWYDCSYHFPKNMFCSKSVFKNKQNAATIRKLSNLRGDVWKHLPLLCHPSLRMWLSHHQTLGWLPYSFSSSIAPQEIVIAESATSPFRNVDTLLGEQTSWEGTVSLKPSGDTGSLLEQHL